MFILALVAAYLIGSIPMGYLVVRFLTGQDLRRVGSGRTGATNALRAGGLYVGAVTAGLDVAKGFSAIWVARALIQMGGWDAPFPPWMEVAAGVATVIGHNYSIYLRFRGGVGTGAHVGVTIALWPWAALLLGPFVPAVLFFTGYASVASLSTAVLIPILFAVLAAQVGLPWENVVYGAITFFLVTWALRPNLGRLRRGEERRVGPRAGAASSHP